MTNITITGNATSDCELTFAQSGTALARFTVAVSKREKQPDGSWGDGATSFYRVTAFQQLAEHAAESVKRGDRVTVVGRLELREYEHNGEKRLSPDVAADEVALSLRFATATATKAQRQPAQQSQGGPRQQADPWAGPQQGQQAQAWGGGGMPAGTGPHDEPPFTK